MNILPKDIVTYIYRIIHKLNIKELNSEFLNVSKVYCDNHNLYWTLDFKNRGYNNRWVGDFLCRECKNNNNLAHNKCDDCNDDFAQLNLNNLPKRYIYSSGLTHPYAYKQRELI